MRTPRAEQPQLEYALATIPAGGTLIVCRLIHIGRSLEHLFDLLNRLDRHGIRLRILHEQLDTAEHGELLRQATHGLADAQKAWRSEATRHGLAAAAADGRRPGRRPNPPLLTTDQEELARQLQATSHTLAEIADLLGVSRTAMYRAQPFTRPPTTGEDSAP